MGGLSPIHWLIVIAVVAILFGGRGKLSGIMGDAAKGIRAFKDGLKDEPPQTPAAPVQITSPPQAAAPVAPQSTHTPPTTQGDLRDPSR